ncbi:sulfate adenylyltransferase subunit CysD, partial [Rhodococcus hoagii]|nr:sulfate adenylyltransferase subunit CysD [Prescottella equi]
PQAGTRPLQFDAAFGGARRDEEKSRAKERVFSGARRNTPGIPSASVPNCGGCTTSGVLPVRRCGCFPLSNWTELDVWEYIRQEDIPIVPLYFAAKRPVVERDGTLIMVDDDRMPLRPARSGNAERTVPDLGCYPLTGAVESTAATLTDVIQEMLLTTTSERQGRVIDHDSSASMEKKKQEGYF